MHDSLNRSDGLRNIVWAVDAFQEDRDLFKLMTDALKEVTHGLKVSILPVHVLSPSGVDMSPGDLDVPWMNEYRGAAERALKFLLKDVVIEGLQEPKVLVREVASLTTAVESLISSAKGFKADLLVVGSHGRKGLPRIFMGSFAETLLLKSPIPVLVINPKNHSFKEVKKILVPTDFSESSQEILAEIAIYAKSVGAQITLYHKVLSAMNPMLQSGMSVFGGEWIPSPVALSNRISEAREKASVWKKWLEREMGVEVEIHVDGDQVQLVSSLLQYASQGAFSLIAMASTSGTLASALIGSVTRQVVRDSPCPVWVIHHVQNQAAVRYSKSSNKKEDQYGSQSQL